ncbi:EAL domain-containing protein [Oscillatoria sp. CS-180]|uniref:sensor domain-containing protein n=1 Tax=Oscillatoria sp. CS-180 TaxID=3021720 RepID=UPI00232BC07D|nr:EAL domain-containing protein [Oscillatoria sp. CS-180]MDB9529880.1 EAL domain-containing protein [Oscillatoria sp. CS-180]
MSAVMCGGVLMVATVLWNRQLQAEKTRRQQAEQRLQKSEEQLRLALELTHISLWDWHIADNHFEWNENHFRLLGLDPHQTDLSYQLWRKAIHPNDIDHVEHAVETAISAQTGYWVEYRVVHPDDSIHWMLEHGSAHYNDGKANRMLGVMLDITERRHIEEALRQSEAAKQQILEAIPDLLIWMSADGICEGFAGGSNIVKLFSPFDAIGINHYEVLPHDISQKRRQAVEAVLSTGKMQLYEQQLEFEGEIHYEEVRVVPIQADKVLIIIRNINNRKQAEIALAESEQRYRIVTENMTDLVCLHKPDGQYVYVTPSCESLLGYSRDELIGQNPDDLLHPDDVSRLQLAHSDPRSKNPLPITYRIRHKLGGYIWLETLIKPILDETGHVLHLQSTSREVGDRVLMEQRLRHDALHDALTRLPNRLLLLQRLELAIKRSKHQTGYYFAVLFIDFDRFKVINDSLGHSIGDQLLTTVAQKFCNFVRKDDLVARIGGDEFVVLLEDIKTPDRANRVAERIVEDLRAPLLIQGQEIFISASIGIVVDAANHNRAEDLIRNADIAMYRAKASGRDKYAVFDPQMHAQVLKRMQLENDLRKAVDHHEFALAYQPIVSLKSLRITGFEALIRWQHPTLGLVTPDKFIDVVEETDLIIPVGEWVLLTACQQVAAWQSQVPNFEDLKLTVNLSVKQLRESVLIPQLNKVLTQTQIKPHCLTLEITESLLVENIDATSSLLNQVQSMGFKISIDDFGTGYSSLSYLHQLPVDSLKIDRTFVSPEEPTLRNQTIAESIVGLSNLLELKAIAEGIETPQQLEWLQTLHCEYGQGYLFSKPIMSDQVEHLLKKTYQF